ncbi:hypothetical protein AB0H76_15110 [Nocardia sp. NPDC050712]|uniref:hypothetical protein n=1 Tax=Nocardia sp. NPDC050712 TaxID=3155518 RepID=UPI0033EF1D75
MSTDIAVPERNSPVALTSAMVVSLQDQVAALDAAYRLAQSLCKTTFAPKDYRGKPQDGAVAILFGQKLGLDAVQSLQNVIVIHGKPSLEARTMRAVLLAHGHKVWTVETTAERAVVRGRRADADSDEQDEESVWDMERVRKAGYEKRNEKYRTEPTNMLYARALAETCRRTAPELLIGIEYDPNELRDIGPTQATSERVTAADIIAAPQEPEQALEPEPAEEWVDVEVEETPSADEEADQVEADPEGGDPE